ncbi:MAG: DUF87 domain-containing protein [Anaerolineales bacterium]|nr:DUF87 domain-containing protein [Anaerolineales bacterium]MDW8162503.1 DUF87 domain-containing protein [Anaerolineales bacterium]
MNTDGKFYLGRIVDPQTQKATDQPLLYKSEDLTTHAFVVGMTGSGKTGLCICLLEEAALQGIPALILDPKGDMTNLLLHFPNLEPQDFEPWVNADLARREGKTIQQAAQEAATLWKQGLADWGITPQRVQQLAQAAQFTVYTPGSDSGIPVNILTSFEAPDLAWDENREALREKIASTVTALLGLVGLSDVDPLRSREHILLSNLLEHAWIAGRDLSLGELILQTQSPPFTKLGVFDVDTFFPQKDRFALAMLLNNILAAPSFQTWIEGEPLEIQKLLYGEDGRPRHSVFYLAHLSESERMFFVTLLYTAVESWMRAQPGSGSLRAIVYFDEVFGYLPPVSNPPSKTVILRMLKQARAFGVAQMLVTQNPVDIDYKALANAGTWCIGKLQTDQDKQRLLDGLESAVPGGMNRSEYDKLISGLGKRVFLMHNVHAKGPLLFQTRWAMNYLAGPLTRAQIPALNRLARAEEVSAPKASARERATAQAVSTPPTTTPKALRTEAYSATKPPAPAGVAEIFLPVKESLSKALQRAGLSPSASQRATLIYRPALLAQVNIRYVNRKYGLDSESTTTIRVPNPDRRGFIRWEEHFVQPIDLREAHKAPPSEARFASLEVPLSDAKLMAAMQKDFLDWAFRNAVLSIEVNDALQIACVPPMTEGEFRARCAEIARQKRDEEVKKAAQTFDKKIEALRLKLVREEQELEADKEKLNLRRMEEMGTHAENILGLFGGRRSSRRISSSLTKRRLTSQAKAEVEESEKTIALLKEQIAEIEKAKEAALEEIHQRWAEIAAQVREESIQPLKKDLFLEFFGIVWQPYYLVQEGEKSIELAAYASQA